MKKLLLVCLLFLVPLSLVGCKKESEKLTVAKTGYAYSWVGPNAKGTILPNYNLDIFIFDRSTGFTVMKKFYCYLLHNTDFSKETDLNIKDYAIKTEIYLVGYSEEQYVGPSKLYIFYMSQKEHDRLELTSSPKVAYFIVSDVKLY